MYHAVNLKPVKDELPQDSDEFLELVELSLPEVEQAIAKGLICDSKTLIAVMYWKLMQ